MRRIYRLVIETTGKNIDMTFVTARFSRQLNDRLADSITQLCYILEIQYYSIFIFFSFSFFFKISILDLLNYLLL